MYISYFCFDEYISVDCRERRCNRMGALGVPSPLFLHHLSLASPSFSSFLLFFQSSLISTIEKHLLNQCFQFYSCVYFPTLFGDIIFGSEISSARSIFPVTFGRAFLCAKKRFALISSSIKNMIFFYDDIETDRPPPEPPPFHEDEIIWVGFFSVTGETRTNSTIISLPVAGETRMFKSSFDNYCDRSRSSQSAGRVYFFAGLAIRRFRLESSVSMSHPIVAVSFMIVMFLVIFSNNN
ncbi:unnamed protein product [Cuscuta europaea]|uniref:Uncharacterized protein n=1 Tax=Cuscuta europaea TaxID=41803 RepID=A0A9P0YK97_CUSEU|nr:unnamed protein product [Cuscuta europaea]